MSDETPTRLKSLLQQRHLYGYSAFCVEYDKIARVIDPKLAGSYPSRAQFHRWVTGTVKKLPYAHHRAVLELMFPEWSIEQLFQAYHEESNGQSVLTPGPLPKRDMQGFLGLVDATLQSPDRPTPSWESPAVQSTTAASVAPSGPSPISSYNTDLSLIHI